MSTTRDQIQEETITLGGYGAVFILKTKTQRKYDFTKRLFSNKISTTTQQTNSRLFSSNITDNISHNDNYAAPFQGDSGGPVFSSENLSIVKGIISGMKEIPNVQYVNVTQQDVEDLLLLLENKDSGVLESHSMPVPKENSKYNSVFFRVSDSISSALDKQDVGLFMQAIELLNSSIS